MTQPSEPTTFGHRFLEAWKRLGGPMSNWTYAEIQELRGCDKEGMVQALREQVPGVTYATLQRLRAIEGPEQLAEVMLTRYARQQAAAAGMHLWMFIAFAT